MIDYILLILFAPVQCLGHWHTVALSWLSSEWVSWEAETEF